ncbi:hypothetical protein K503DRAFT_692081 [Rhizopogon vinicolor AM-OR11-026]|uniref:FAD-binding FR-type domain-containing protein n=1 Tax=Rhizopogon vinicolor AM-OR11-026 TaxID=1314800 RepID=A0A1B7MZV1_9AGAM|nr:hypothetical protein K503DRAFT_692081 [Rhizopogon vinicolor AM-OR11-026]
MYPSSKSETDRLTLLAHRDLGSEQVWYVLASFHFVVGCFQWGSSIHSKFARRRRLEPDEETASNHIHHKHEYPLCRVPLAFVDFYRVAAFRWTLEIGQIYTINMAEVFITLAHIALTPALTVSQPDRDRSKLPHPFWNSRVAVVAISQFPILTVLGTKNNLVSLITGISYDRLNSIHRMMARACFVLLLIHSVSEAYNYPHFGSTLDKGWLRVNMVAFSILIIVSLRPIRSDAYELFPYTHFPAVLIFLIGGYYHTSASNLSVWVWPSFVFWAFDRFVHVVRLVAFNHSHFGFKSGSGAMDATAELLSENVVRLRCCRSQHFHWSPGQSAYLTMPSVLTLPFEAHPFTIVSVDSSLFSTTAPEYPSESDANKDIQASASSAPHWKELVFLITMQKGFTKKLKAVAARRGQVKVFIDGPHGQSPDLNSYDACVLVTGGCGVSYTLPVFLSVIERVRNGERSCSRVVFIWSIREAAHVQWIEETPIKAVQLAPSFDSIYSYLHHWFGSDVATSKDNTAFSLPDSVEKNGIHKPSDASLAELSSLGTVGSIKVHHGRPNLDALLKEEINMASGRMSVTVCGSHGICKHAGLLDPLRFPVCGPSNILNEGPSVTLYVASFGYA